METKEIKIQIPEGYEIDKEKTTFENIVFKSKEKGICVKSWEEYLRSGNHPNKLWFINPAYKSTDGICSTGGDLKKFDLNKSACNMSAYLPSKEYAEAFLAMMQLISLRQSWIGDWKPDWSYESYHCYCIVVVLDNVYTVEQFSRYNQTLSFPSKEMAIDFMNCFKDLLEIAKPLI